ncbi:prepilin-type N-terminal cleavage/methylation domain-containing protein [Clostridium lundense]|uniref:prepilin-type N-terminal cleavage/methylation domain-containing protein n=1 Tax=Clostridium lundense TaxID=319475 RepID=UPI0004861199|nr:prepilin-type N-terminal cleavage/methylation domain-containing protein [Clostridium lundense]
MKKGFSLIEILISISIISIISLAGIRSLIIYLNLYRKESNHIMEEFYVDQAFIFIEQQLDAAESIDIFKNNKDVNEIKVNNKDKSNYIKLKNGKLVISYNKSNSKYSNTIMYDVKSFLVEGVCNTVYVKIKTKYGREYERCFGIRKKEDLFLYIPY